MPNPDIYFEEALLYLMMAGSFAGYLLGPSPWLCIWPMIVASWVSNAYSMKRAARDMEAELGHLAYMVYGTRGNDPKVDPHIKITFSK